MVLLFRTDQANLELIGKLRDVTSLCMALAMQLRVTKQERARVGAFFCQGGCLAHTDVLRLFCDTPLPTFTVFDEQNESGTCVHLFHGLLTHLDYKLHPDSQV